MARTFTWLVAAALLMASFVVAQDPFVGGYVLLSRTARNGEIVGIDELKALAASAATLPVTRIWLSFFAPTLVYVPGSFTLQYARLNVSNTGDYGFSDIRQAILQLQGAGVEVFLSMGGWNYNCFPYLYARYSVGGYGQDTPNFYKIQQFGGGNLDNCVDKNQYCYVCEPPTENTTLADFEIFPEPQHSATWQQATAYVQTGSNSTYPPQWNYDMVPGSMWTDAKTGISTRVPGNPYYITQNRDPYQDFVYLAKDLGAAGIDIDYEEFWHADYFKIGPASGPWALPQTVYKYSAIMYDVILNIKNIYPTLKLSSPGGAVGAWSSNWWGGNLKGVWYFTKQWYPEIISFLTAGANAGGINVMTYDLSDNTQYHECPQDDVCQLDQQVQFYMQTYQEAGIPANVGYEVGVPAYPAPDHDPSHQLPLTDEMLKAITWNTQTHYTSGFFWELFKSQNQSSYATPTQVAQAICNIVLKNERCSGVLPNITSHQAQRGLQPIKW